MKRRISLIVVIAFIAVATLGLGLSSQRHNDPSMPECESMQNGSAVCPLTAQERLQKWQELSVMALQSFKTPLAALFALAIMLYAFPLGIRRDPGLFAHVPLGPPLNRRNDVAKLKNPIQQALSQGLLNPHID